AFTQYQTQVKSLLGDVQINASLSDAEIVKTLAEQQIQLTLKNTQEQAKTAKTMLNTTKLAGEANLAKSQNTLTNAQLNYQKTSKNKASTLGLLQNGIQQAEIAYQDALDLYHKLSVQSPIDGSIGDILVEKGQEIRPGMPLFKVINDQQAKIYVFVTAEEQALIHTGTQVDINYKGDSFTGVIQYISSVA
ncbi:MAG: HlyD family efflux transporter periplasmic adaptor subunit, partial [bacterium]|nr:HlyD family efflux transporter periplasmic adaptor subunit [bacterium]